MKENQLLALDMELVTVMDHVLVKKDGPTLHQPEKSVIAQLNAQETAQDMEPVNVEFVTVTQDSNFSQIAHAKTVKNNVLNSKCVPAMENVLASQDFLDLTVKQRLTVDPKLTALHA